MSIPAVLGAVVLELKDFKSLHLNSADMVSCGIATVIRMVRNKKYIGFSVYCVIMGMFTIGYYFFS